LLTLSAAGVAAIYTDYKTERREDRHGNRYALTGTALVARGGQYQWRRTFDVILTVK
jgi:hypothetical protein